MKKGYLLSNPGNGFPDKVKKRLKKDLSNRQYTIVFIPCNYDQILNNEKYHKINTQWFTECGILFKNNILLNKNMSSKELKLHINSADVLFLMGGLQLEQMKFCYEKDIVNDITNFDGIVIGICAGAINMATDVTSLYMSNMNTPIQTYYKGFSLVDFNIIAHVSIVDEFILHNNDYVILPDESAIIVASDKVEYVGKFKIIKRKKRTASFPDFPDLKMMNKKKFVLLLVNLVFINCCNNFVELNKNQLAEFKQMFKYIMFELNMNYQDFLQLFNRVKDHYKISSDDHLKFLHDEYLFIRKALSNAKKEITCNSQMSVNDLDSLIYDRYGVKLNETNRF